MNEYIIAIRRLVASSIEAHGMLKDVVTKHPTSISELNQALALLSEFPRLLEEYDRAMIVLDILIETETKGVAEVNDIREQAERILDEGVTE